MTTVKVASKDITGNKIKPSAKDKSGIKRNVNLEARFDYMRCGECLHFKKSCHPHKEDICSKLGVKAFNKAPTRCFTPNVMELITNSDQLAALTNLWSNFNTKQRRIFTHLLAKKAKVKFGSRVAFKAVGKDYLSNYVSGFIVGKSSSGDILLCGDPDNYTRGNNYVACIKADTPVFTISEFKKKRDLLIENNRIIDPDKPLLKFKKKVELESYIPPTIDSTPKIKKHKGRKSLTDIINIG